MAENILHPNALGHFVNARVVRYQQVAMLRIYVGGSESNIRSCLP